MRLLIRTNLLQVICDSEILEQASCIYVWPERPHIELPTTMNLPFFTSCDPHHQHSHPHGPAELHEPDVGNTNEVDHVPYLSCSSWPPIAKSWIDRKRPFNWPSKEIIQIIVSKGCRIVHKPHELSKDKESEFRFSFSEAERILFGTFTCDQRKCFVAFKAFMKYSICKLEYETKYDINLSSYCLKTVFLWTCETFPACICQNTSGWSMCLLYMIDLLRIFLKIGNLPGYLIPACNLLDTVKHSPRLRIGSKKV